MNEPEVIQKVHRFLRTSGVDGEAVVRLFTDSHPTLTGIPALKPFQRFSVDVGHKVFHPDLVAQQADSESLIAIEAKGSASEFDWGLTQAEAYQRAVQRSFIALPANELNEAMVGYACSKGIGVLAVREDVKVLHLPQSRWPLAKDYKALVTAIGATAWVNESGTFQFNLPTHYLVWVTALDAGRNADLSAAERRLESYPMPTSKMGALRGAQKLGLVWRDGKGVGLTDVGLAVKDLLPPSIEEWATIHRAISQAGGPTLWEVHRQSAAVLRVLLLQDPVVRLVMEGLKVLGTSGGSFAQLAAACFRLDRSRATAFFLNPERAASSIQSDGTVAWSDLQGEDYRSTTFFQYKSVMKHAGLLDPTRLGGASAKDYKPESDVWRLAGWQ